MIFKKKKSFLNRKIFPKSWGAQDPQYLLNSKQGVWINLSSESSFVIEAELPDCWVPPMFTCVWEEYLAFWSAMLAQITSHMPLE